MKTLAVADIFFNSWAELNWKQAIELLSERNKIAQAQAEGLHGVAGHRIFITLRLLAKDKKLFKKLNADQLLDVYTDMAWIHQPWYTFHIQALAMPDKFLIYAPDEYMHNCIFKQLVHADALFSKYLIANDVKDLHRLIAVLYQFTYNFKELPFNPDHMDRMADEIARVIKPGQAELILHTYANIREYITKRCPNLFPIVHPSKADDLANSKPMQYTGPMWQSIHFDLAETEAFKGFETSGNTRIYDALDYLEQKAIAAKPKS
jgi:hypothetical protein